MLRVSADPRRLAPFKSGAAGRANASGLGRGAQPYSNVRRAPDDRRPEACSRLAAKRSRRSRAEQPAVASDRKLGRLPQPYSKVRRAPDDRRPEACSRLAAKRSRRSRAKQPSVASDRKLGRLPQPYSKARRGQPPDDFGRAAGGLRSERAPAHHCGVRALGVGVLFRPRGGGAGAPHPRGRRRRARDRRRSSRRSARRERSSRGRRRR